MQTFTRNELIRTALNSIRNDVRHYRKTNKFRWITHAINTAWALNTLNIISTDKALWLETIIANSISHPEILRA